MIFISINLIYLNSNINSHIELIIIKILFIFAQICRVSAFLCCGFVRNSKSILKRHILIFQERGEPLTWGGYLKLPLPEMQNKKVRSAR